MRFEGSLDGVWMVTFDGWLRFWFMVRERSSLLVGELPLAIGLSGRPLLLVLKLSSRPSELWTS